MCMQKDIYSTTHTYREREREMTTIRTGMAWWRVQNMHGGVFQCVYVYTYLNSVVKTVMWWRGSACRLCMGVYVSVCMYISKFNHTHIRTHTHRCVRQWFRQWWRGSACRICICVYVCVCMGVCVSVHMCIHIWIQPHTRIRTHTHRCVRQWFRQWWRGSAGRLCMGVYVRTCMCINV